MLQFSFNIFSLEMLQDHTHIDAADLGAADGPSADVGREYLPLGIDVGGIECLVVGGGRVAARKAATFLSHGADVRVVSPGICGQLQELVDAGEMAWKRAIYDCDCLGQAVFVVAATSSADLNARIAEDAEAQDKLVCVASSGKLSRVIFPARYSADGVTVAVHTNGRDCLRSKEVRDDIASVLPGRGKGKRAQVGVVGIELSRLPSSLVRKLRQLAESKEFAAMSTHVIVLMTCWRWECFFLSSTARSTAGEVIDLVSSYLGEQVLLDGQSGWRLSTGGRAYHHLLRVLCGLDSPIVGETEIVGQVRQAALHLQGSDEPLLELFNVALLDQKQIRKASGLAPASGSWSSAVIETVSALRQSGPATRVCVVGQGKLGVDLTERLKSAGAGVVAFSRRVEAPGGPAAGEDVLPTERLVEFLVDTEVLVLCAPLDESQCGPVAGLAAAGLVVVDLDGGHETIRAAATEGNYVAASDVACCPDVAQIASVARAEILATRQAIVSCRGARSMRLADRVRMAGRPSHLSHVQMAEVIDLLKALDEKLAFEAVCLATPGDRDRATPLPVVVEEDFFTRDLDEAVLSGRADLAIHSVKDLPSRLAEGLCVAAVLPSVTSPDCFVGRDGRALRELPVGAKVGTSSQRRQDALAALRPDVAAVAVRGNVPERLHQMDAGDYDGLILAAAGLVRLGLANRITEVLSPAACPPAAGQGALALVVRREDEDLRRFLEPLDLGDRRQLPCR
ncbi:MAG: hydroxymethylbilane synthase [Planctomycetota bacterium]